MKKVKILTEAGSTVGLGHFTRCFALYSELSKSFMVDFYICSDITLKNYSNIKVIYENWHSKSFIKNHIAKTDYVIVDSYLTSQDFCKKLSKAAKLVMYIDDTNRIPYSDGIILNPSLECKNIKYEKQKNIKYLIGEEYIILRNEFRTYENFSNNNGVITNILITFGGTDIRKISFLFTNWIRIYNKNYNIKVIISDQNEIHKIKNKFHDITIMSDLNGSQILAEYNWADMVICGAGQTVYELLAIGKTFFPIKIIDNQDANVEGLIQHGYFNEIPAYDDLELKEKLYDFLEHPKMFKRNRNIINGVTNIIEEVKNYDA